MLQTVLMFATPHIVGGRDAEAHLSFLSFVTLTSRSWIVLVEYNP